MVGVFWFVRFSKVLNVGVQILEKNDRNLQLDSLINFDRRNSSDRQKWIAFIDRAVLIP